MASYLGVYANAAARRDEKIVRAINSVLDNVFTDFEIQVVADGCQRTVDIVSGISDPRVNVTLIDKRPFWDGAPRNTGIEKANGDYIIYLDNDDFYGQNHLWIVDRYLDNYDWVYYDDYFFQGGVWRKRHCNIRKMGMNGTSNVCHRRTLGVQWGYRGYSHDHYFNQKLMFFKNNTKISTPEYFVCHAPGYYDI